MAIGTPFIIGALQFGMALDLLFRKSELKHTGELRPLFSGGSLIGIRLRPLFGL